MLKQCSDFVEMMEPPQRRQVRKVTSDIFASIGARFDVETSE